MNSMQLYSARNFPPLADQLSTLASLGYKAVEPFGGLYEDLDALAGGVQANGFSVPSGHFSVDLLENRFDRTLEIVRRLNIGLVVVPYLLPADRPNDADGWRAFAQRLAAMADRVSAEGLRFAWHNHDFEMRALDDGSRPIEHILEASGTIAWEADAAWIVRGGEDPVRWIERYNGRIDALHVKDIAPAGEKTDEDGWADVGTGTMDWPAIWRAAKAAGCDLMVAEHDNPSDFRRFAETSLRAMNGFEGN
ncbi:sugar phosphate isomerase/epimerase family protein [Aureimonas jatrophae]|uniref:Sugar phosphate isomerase/epimerase n=1 Tax=Aureimonas jatrophae TaxID=1166073 RepID=A0A1H0D0G8_9HYPH|nr:sugar phosphate isomerase/epimerase [Aureimonas jatrophae]MBB3949440.1 sugar phosphate isomerase/epimerase [Aureimonas jatrophae]SDN63673.1 Sugar phosphate isomerase/epimerase [Aureimonas jatrophae]